MGAHQGRKKTMTELSAALTLVQWGHEHGRNPRDADARGSGGLLWQSTYYRIFGMSSFSTIVDKAFAMVSSCAYPYASISRRKTKPCLNHERCGQSILDEGAHIRMCSGCRKQLDSNVDWLDRDHVDYHLSKSTMERFGIGRDGWMVDVMDWDD